MTHAINSRAVAVLIALSFLPHMACQREPQEARDPSVHPVTGVPYATENPDGSLGNRQAAEQAVRETEEGNQAATEVILTLGDGSSLAISNVAAAPDWACGTRKSGTMEVPGHGAQPVTIYYDRSGKFVTLNEPRTNTVLYDERDGRECLMNWKTGQNEMLTEAEYERFEREADG